MENGQKKLKELFDGTKTFKIPDYQRAYAWDETRQLPDFVEDIENQAVGRDYFLGTILFQENGDKRNGFDLIDIVDGQQRITTVIIFMKVLLTELREKMTDESFEANGLDLVQETYIENKKRPKLLTITPDNDFFQNYILGDDDGGNFIETPSQRRLYKAKKYFQSCLADRSNDELLELKSKLDEGSKVLTYSVKGASEAALIFETTNDRGKGLTNLEKIKSFLMYKAYLAAEDNVDTHLASIQQRFTEIYREVELFDGRHEEDAVLQYHCIAFEGWKSKEDYQHPVSFVRAILNPLIKQGKKEKALEFIERFSRELKESFRVMRDLSKSKVPEYRDLACLERLGNFTPLLLKSLKLDATPEKVNFRSVCRLLEIYSFRVYSLQQSRSNAGRAQLFRFARDFSGKFEPLCDNLTSMIKEFSPKKKFLERLNYSDLFTSIASRDLSYLFWKYENHLRQKEQPICSNMSEEEYQDTSSKTRLTVEHIASQNPKEHGILKSVLILPNIDAEFVEEHIHNIGNLTFDPASANSSKGNNDVDIKNSKYFLKAPYKTQNELEDFLHNEKWDEISIQKRGQKVVEFCTKNWSPEYVEY